MKFLWNDYEEAIGDKRLLYAHCDESLDAHGQNSLYHLKMIEEYLGDILMLSSVCSKEDALGILEELTYFHDLGKANLNFQKKLILNCKGKKTSLPPHSENGFLKISEYVFSKCKTDPSNETLLLAFLLSTIVDRHHSKLKNLDYYVDYPNLGIYYSNAIKYSERWGYRLYFMYRLFYSCLKTADIFASSFGNNKENIERNIITKDKVIKYKDRFEKYLKSLKSENPLISRCRENFRKKAMDKTNMLLKEIPQKRIFYLYLPTGGGKTLTSLSVALEIVEKKNLKRIFYVFPYINIIEQNSLVLKNIFEDDLQAIHTYSDPTEIKTRDEKEEELDYKSHLNTETFNFPAVVISSVRFFDILLSNKKNSVLKTWALANSVVIIDEVQYFPKKYWEAFITLLGEFGELFNTYFILMSATLPRLDIFLEKDKKNFVGSIIQKKDILENLSLFENRTHIETLETKNDNIEDTIFRKAIDLLHHNKKVLIVFNTIGASRRTYQKLCNQLKNVEVYLLNSTILYPRRLEILEALSRDDEYKKILVSTQSIEAGVDLDFDVGIRERAPPESIIQIMGRINREIKNKNSSLYVTSNSETMSKIYNDFHRLNVDIPINNLNNSHEIDKYFDKTVEKLRIIGTESPKILHNIKKLKFEELGFNEIIEKATTLDVFFEGKIKVKNKYIVGKNEIKLGEKLRQILEEHGFKETYTLIPEKECIILDSHKFISHYDSYLKKINNLSYKERISHLIHIKNLEFIQRLFCFSLRWFGVKDLGIFKSDEYERKWINEKYYSYENGFIPEETLSEDYIWA
ncbi:MAG: CRISPR-associated helicase Cas3' [Candidatus Micrarchaeia archaeon]